MRHTWEPARIDASKCSNAPCRAVWPLVEPSPPSTTCPQPNAGIPWGDPLATPLQDIHALYRDEEAKYGTRIQQGFQPVWPDWLGGPTESQH